MLAVCEELDKANRDYLWSGAGLSKRMHLLSWEKVCTFKADGGLGLQRARNSNLAFFGQLGWQVITNENKLWVEVVRHKYWRDEGCKRNSCASHTWKSIWEGVSIAKHGLGLRVGNGRQICFWRDVWIGKEALVKFCLRPLSERGNEKSDILLGF